MTTHADERGYLVDCIDCGAPVDPGMDRPYALTDAIVLCHACALSRGGAYDSDSEHWPVQPSLEGIPRERLPEA
jgi:hypothetical protein